MTKYRIWYDDGKYDDFFDGITAKELIQEYSKSWKTVKTVTTEIYEKGKYIGEVDYPWKEFCEIYLENT